MCELKSWIEKDGEVYHLTDLDLEDPVIKKRLAGCKDNDIIGHGAIEKAFTQAAGGIHEEERAIWDVSRFPKPIAKTLGKNFDKYYLRMFAANLSNDDLRYIIEYGPPEYKAKARQILLIKDPSKGGKNA